MIEFILYDVLLWKLLSLLFLLLGACVLILLRIEKGDFKIQRMIADDYKRENESRQDECEMLRKRILEWFGCGVEDERKIKNLTVERDEMEEMWIEANNRVSSLAHENMILKNDCGCGHGCACETADPIIEEHVEPFVDRDGAESIVVPRGTNSVDQIMEKSGKANALKDRPLHLKSKPRKSLSGKATIFFMDEFDCIDKLDHVFADPYEGLRRD